MYKAVRENFADLTVFINLPVEVTLKRHEQNCSEWELEEQTQTFEDLYKNNPNVVCVDGTKSPEDLKNEVINIIQEQMKSFKGHI